MMNVGAMVRARNTGPMMRITDRFRDMARCVFVDSHGRMHQRFEYVYDLSPFWLALTPRSLWPEAGDLDQVELEREQAAIAAERAVAKKTAKKAARKPRISRRIKGRTSSANAAAVAVGS